MDAQIKRFNLFLSAHFNIMFEAQHPVYIQYLHIYSQSKLKCFVLEKPQQILPILLVFSLSVVFSYCLEP